MFSFGFRTFLSCIFSNIAKKLFNPNLGGVGVSLNNSETVKAITLAFCSTQYLIIRDIRGKFGIPNFSQSLDIGQISDGCISVSGFPVNPL